MKKTSSSKKLPKEELDRNKSVPKEQPTKTVEDLQANILIIGGENTGKTNIIYSYGENRYINEYSPSAYNHFSFRLMNGNKQIAISLQ